MDEFSQQSLIYVLIAGAIGMLLLVGGIAIFVAVYQKRIWQEQYKQKLLDEKYAQRMIELQLESQEQERKRIAADMHDSIGSLLWSAKLNASFLERSSVYDTEQRQSYNELMNALDTSIGTVKRIAWELTPQAFFQEGFADSVSKLCTAVNGRPLIASFEQNATVTWNDDRALSAYRIVQELMANCIKHAKANHVSTSLTWEHEQVLIFVVDDGVGFTLDKERAGVGWWNIHQRVKKLNAVISIGETPSRQGTSVSIKIPLLP